MTVEAAAVAQASAPAVVDRSRPRRRASPALRNAIAADAAEAAPRGLEVDAHRERPPLRPDGIDVALRGRVMLPSTITWRLDFVSELHRLTEDV